MHDLGLRLTDLALTKRGRQHVLDLQKASVRLVLNKIKEMGFAMMQSWILVMRLTIRSSGPRGSTSPSVDELKSEIRDRLALPEHANKLKSELRWLFEEESLKDTNNADANFHQLIFTPPYVTSHAAIGASVGLHEELRGV